MKIGIYGGSFNPIHNGHIAMAKAMRKTLGLDEVWLMITPLNPFKWQSTDLLDDHKRLAIAREALRNEPHIRASEYEFRLLKPSYTWQTLQALRRDYPEHEFILLIGADNWVAFDRWRDYRDILATTTIAVYPREGSPIDKSTLPPNVILVDTPLLPISSTQIRQRIATGASLLGLVPRHVIARVRKYYREHLKKLAQSQKLTS